MQHEKIVRSRKLYGDNWVTSFPDGLEVPWRQLTLQEYMDYTYLLQSSHYTETELEDEIFCKVVLDPLYVDNIDILTTGTVTSVVAQVLQVSGPATVQQINHDLQIAREETADFMSTAIPLICSVFPAYKPEELLNMKYQDFMKRLAMAETRLMSLRLLNEPLQALGPGEVEQVQQQEPPSVRKRREILEQKRAQIEKKMGDLNPVQHPEGVITQSQMRLGHGTLSLVDDLSNDPQDHLVNQMKINKAKDEALSGLRHIYPEYFKMMEEGKKLTPDVVNQVKDERHKPTPKPKPEKVKVRRK